MKAFKSIQAAQAPQAIGCYSQAVQVGDWLILSGQIGLEPQTQALVDGFAPQCHQIFQNIGEILKAGHCDWTNVVKLTIYITDMTLFPIINEIMPQYVPEPYPARAVVGVQSLPKGAVIEIETLAYKLSN